MKKAPGPKMVAAPSNKSKEKGAAPAERRHGASPPSPPALAAGAGRLPPIGKAAGAAPKSPRLQRAKSAAKVGGPSKAASPKRLARGQTKANVEAEDGRGAEKPPSPKAAVGSEPAAPAGPAVEVKSDPPQPLGVQLPPTVAMDPEVLQTADLALVSMPVARQRFVASLSGSSPRKKGPASRFGYVVMAPKLLGSKSKSGSLCISDHHVEIRGASLWGTPVQTFDFHQFVLANVPFSALESLAIEHTFVSHQVVLTERTPEIEACPVPALEERERLTALADDGDRIDKMRELLKAAGLDRKDDERDVAYAGRLGVALGSDKFAYDAAATDNSLHLLPTAIFELGRGDCTAYNAGFVYALRAYGIPARMRLGMKFGPKVQELCGAFSASHTCCEFFANGIGWVPCDATGGVSSFKSADDFVQWHSAHLSFCEFEEQSLVLRSTTDLASKVLLFRKACSRNGLPDYMPATLHNFSLVLRNTFQMSEGAALNSVASVGKLLGKEVSDKMTPVDFLEAWTAVVIGRCPVHFGTGLGLCSSAAGGVAILEGGPYENDVPLDTSELGTCMVTLAGHEHVSQKMGVRAFGAGEDTSESDSGDDFARLQVSFDFSTEPPAK